MNYLFEKAPLFVPGMKLAAFEAHDLERRESMIIQEKQGSTAVEMMRE